MSIQRFIRQRPALSFLGLVIGWSFPYMWFVLTLLPLDPIRGPSPIQIGLVAVGTSPSLFGILLTYLSGGKQGLRALFSRAVRWRVGLAWYVTVLLLVPGLNLVTYMIYSQSDVGAYSLPSGPLAFAILAGIMTATFEELGWRGFALPALQKRYNALLSSLILGLVWGIWHLPLFYLQRAHFGSLAVPLLLLESLASLTALSVLMTWIHNNASESVLLMILVHFSLTGGNFLLQPPASSSAVDFLRFHLISIAVQSSAAAVIVASFGAHRLVRGERLEAAV